MHGAAEHSGLTNLIRGLYLVFLGYGLYTIWQGTYFVTGDGGSHWHNALAWKEMLLGKSGFYSNYYLLNPSVVPNYCSHLLLSFFSTFTHAAVAEKLLATVYLLVYTGGFVYLNQQFGKVRNMFLWLIFPLAFQYVLFAGFYNYLLSIGIYFFVFGWYTKQYSDSGLIPTRRTILLFTLWSSLLFLTHVFGFLLLMVSVALHQGLRFLWRTTDAPNRWQVVKQGFGLALAGIPGWIGFFYFNAKQEAFQFFPQPSRQELYENLRQLTGLQSYAPSEPAWYEVLTIFLAGLWLVGMLLTVVRKKVNTHWFLATALFFFCLLMYFFYRDSALGGEGVKVRFQVLILVFMVLLLGCMPWPKKVVAVGHLAMAVVAMLILYTKQEGIKKMSWMMEDLAEVEPFIPTQSMVLPLSFHTRGIWQDEEISSHAASATNHVASYLQPTQKQWIMADNYEGNTNYFPLQWKPELNPFLYFPNFEAQPPQADVMQYNDRITQIHYVLLFNLTTEDRSSAPYQKLRANLNRGYQLQFTSSKGQAELYKRIW